MKNRLLLVRHRKKKEDHLSTLIFLWNVNYPLICSGDQILTASYMLSWHYKKKATAAWMSRQDLQTTYNRNKQGKNIQTRISYINFDGKFRRFFIPRRNDRIERRLKMWRSTGDRRAYKDLLTSNVVFDIFEEASSNSQKQGKELTIGRFMYMVVLVTLTVFESS